MDGHETREAGDFLAIILDLSPLAWHASAAQDKDGAGLSLDTALETILVFANAHLALRNENELAVYGAGPGRSELFFSSVDLGSEPSIGTDSLSDGNTYQQFRRVDDRIAQGARNMLADGAMPTGQPVNLVGALARSLCHFNRITRDEDRPATHPRILIISVSADASQQYIATMNCIFSAQKSGIPIDICKVFGDDAVFLQQAAFLTSGLYYRAEHRSALLQTLMMAFLPGRAARKHLNLPYQDQVDLRAACFCHRKIVDIGFVCSVCLSIFCSPVPQCSTCKTSFGLNSLKRLANTRGTLTMRR